MELTRLFTMQKSLDTYIQDQHGLAAEQLFEDKLLALLVELSELANETRCFKFWSTKGPSERAVILEEYVDSIHFLLSLGIVKDLTAFNDWTITETSDTLTALFIKAHHAVLVFGNQPDMDSYADLWAIYGQLAGKLGFSPAEIIASYLEKNEKNYERQKSGY